MASVNKVMILGNLGRDPETRYTADGGVAITNVTVATSHRYKDSNGQPQEETEWHRVVFFGRLAEIVSEYLKKGSQVYVEGRLRTRKWQTQDGQDRYSTEIVAESMQMLSARDGADTASSYGNGTESAPRRQNYNRQNTYSGSRQNYERPAPSIPTPVQGSENLDEDIPF